MKVILVIGAVILNMLFYAVTLQAHWAWFVAPLGAPVIGLAHAYGLVCLVKLAITRLDLPTKEQSSFEIIAENLLLCVVMLGTGKIAQLLMAA